MKKQCRHLLFIFSLMGAFLGAEIIQSSSLAPIEEALEEASKDTLVLFDAVDTLITCDEPLFHNNNKTAFSKVSSALFQGMPRERVDEWMTTILNVRKTSLVDYRVLDLIDLIREKKLQMLVLTSCGTGKYGLIDKMEDWRIHQLENLGINFKDLTLKRERWLNSMQGPHGIPLLKQGVVFTAQIDKAIVLEELLRKEHLKPKKILYIDDQLENLKGVEALCDKKGVEFLGFEYTAVKDRSVKKIDEKLIEIQLNVLINEGLWITSDEAAESFNDEN